MSEKSPEVSLTQLGWFVAGAIPFLMSIALLGYSITTQVALSFAVVWPLLQIFGYTMTLKMAKGDPAHHLVKTQVILHWIIVLLLGALIIKGDA
ncbi:hypothetical protein BPTFM16_00378 [Altererythrobacter insulae]|nr:hypothetical protein BPTFM16_00378 [Altererythrobacter insulae]